MENYHWKHYNNEPPKNKLLVAYCRNWNDEGYQICKWDGKKFTYRNQPNDDFSDCVELWSLLTTFPVKIK